MEYEEVFSTTKPEEKLRETRQTKKLTTHCMSW